MLPPFKISLVLKVGDGEIVAKWWMIPRQHLWVAYPSVGLGIIGHYLVAKIAYGWIQMEPSSSSFGNVV